MAYRRLITLAGLIAVGLSLGGCSKCGWIWEDWGGAKPKSCLTDTAPR